jgi:hypothetical protein
MGREHAQEDMGAHPRCQPVVDRAQVQGSNQSLDNAPHVHPVGIVGNVDQGDVDIVKQIK